MSVWFTVQLDDKPGSLARVAAALAERAVNITGIVGVAEDTDGALMLTTSDPAASRAAFSPRPRIRGARRIGRPRSPPADRLRPPHPLPAITVARRIPTLPHGRGSRHRRRRPPPSRAPRPSRHRWWHAPQPLHRAGGRPATTGRRRGSRSRSRSRALTRNCSSGGPRPQGRPSSPRHALAGPDLRQARHRHRWRRAGRPGRPRCGQRSGPPQPPRRADLGRHHRPRRRA